MKFNTWSTKTNKARCRPLSWDRGSTTLLKTCCMKSFMKFHEIICEIYLGGIEDIVCVWRDMWCVWGSVYLYYPSPKKDPHLVYGVGSSTLAAPPRKDTQAFQRNRIYIRVNELTQYLELCVNDFTTNYTYVSYAYIVHTPRYVVSQCVTWRCITLWYIVLQVACTHIVHTNTFVTHCDTLWHVVLQGLF